MIQKKLNNFFFILSTCLIFLGSCKTKKIIDQEMISVNPIKKVDEIVNNVNENNIFPESISLIGKATFKNREKKIDFNLHIVVRKDSLIWASFRSSLLGIEALRVKITPDSIYYLDRLQKTYFKRKFSYLKEFTTTELSYFNLQDILFATPRLLNVSFVGGNFYITGENKIYITSEEGNSYLINNDTYRIEKMFLIDPQNHELNISFNDWKNIEIESSSKHYLAPYKLLIEVETEKKFVFEVDYKKIEIDKSINTTFKIPKSYVEI